MYFSAHVWFSTFFKNHVVLLILWQWWWNTSEGSPCTYYKNWIVQHKVCAKLSIVVDFIIISVYKMRSRKRASYWRQLRHLMSLSNSTSHKFYRIDENLMKRKITFFRKDIYLKRDLKVRNKMIIISIYFLELEI